jgi:RNA polymerase sigma-70 factor (ECF subfamily)
VRALLPMPERSDAELIDAVHAGNQGAFAELIARHEERLFRLLGRFSRDRGEIEDLAQEVFVKVYRKLHTFQQDATFFTWLYRIAVNTANDHLTRRQRRRLHLVEDEEVLDRGAASHVEDEGSAAPLLDEEMRRVTREVLETLPEKYRTILLLREFEDLSYTDMAEVLECSIGTVESRLFRARQRFKEALTRLHPDLVPGRTGSGPRRKER